VQSDLIRSIGYDRGQRCLEVEFVKGVTYRYFEVLPTIAYGLLGAESYGRYFNKHIKEHYAYSVVDAP
jgi:KTSC domain